MLKRPSLAMSVVGLTGNFFGATKRFPLYFPEMMRTYNELKMEKSMLSSSKFSSGMEVLLGINTETFFM